MIANLDNGEKVTITGWGRTPDRSKDKVKQSNRNKSEKRTLQYLRTKTANDLCKEKISQDIDTNKIICAGDDQGKWNLNYYFPRNISLSMCSTISHEKSLAIRKCR